MKSLLYGTLVGLGLGLGSCASSSNHQKGDPTPQLYYQLLGEGTTAKDGTRSGEVTLDSLDRTISARAVVESNGKRLLDILVVDGANNHILYRDGGSWPLDGRVDVVMTQSPNAPKLLIAQNPQDANDGYVAHLTTVSNYLSTTPSGKPKSVGPSELIDQFLKSGRGK